MAFARHANSWALRSGDRVLPFGLNQAPGFLGIPTSESHLFLPFSHNLPSMASLLKSHPLWTSLLSLTPDSRLLHRLLERPLSEELSLSTLASVTLLPGSAAVSHSSNSHLYSDDLRVFNPCPPVLEIHSDCLSGT